MSRWILPVTLLVALSACALRQVPELEEAEAPQPSPEPADELDRGDRDDSSVQTESEGSRQAAGRAAGERNESTAPVEIVASRIQAEADPRSAPAPRAPVKDQREAKSALGKKKSEAAASGGVVVLKGDVARELYAPPPSTPVQPPAADTEHYTDYGVNGFALVADDPLSTFSIDVDTASYTVTRSKLESGYLPPAPAVRVEEFVNYFPYEYRPPGKGDPFSVDFEAAPSPWTPQNHIVRVGIQGKKVAMDERKSVHLTFLVDTSGSMGRENKIGLVKKALILLTQELEDGDTIAIATYAGSTQVVLEPTPISQRAQIIKALERLSSGGSTAMASGIDLAYSLAERTTVQGAVNRVIVCSDGDANVGRTSHEEISQQIRGYAQQGITLTTLGFGNGNYKDTMMERLANDGDGNYFYIDSEREARRVLVDKLSGTLEVIAKDVKIQVEWNPETVLAYRLIGYENRDIADVDFRNDKVDAGEIGAGHQVTALYEVALRDDFEGTLGTVRLRNKAPGPEAPAVERGFDLNSRIVKASFAETHAQTRIAFAAASFAEILRGSLEEVSLGEVAELAAGAKRVEYAEDAELVRLIERAAKLRGEGNLSRR